MKNNSTTQCASDSIGKREARGRLQKFAGVYFILELEAVLHDRPVSMKALTVICVLDCSVLDMSLFWIILTCKDIRRLTSKTPKEFILTSKLSCYFAFTKRYSLWSCPGKQRIRRLTLRGP